MSERCNKNSFEIHFIFPCYVIYTSTIIMKCGQANSVFIADAITDFSL